jgi:hypothetical protein
VGNNLTNIQINFMLQIYNKLLTAVGTRELKPHNATEALKHHE